MMRRMGQVVACIRMWMGWWRVILSATCCALTDTLSVRLSLSRSFSRSLLFLLSRSITRARAHTHTHTHDRSPQALVAQTSPEDLVPRTLVFPAKNTTAQPSRLFWQGAGDEAGWWNPCGETEDKKITGNQEGTENKKNALETLPREQGERGGLVKSQQWHSLARWSDWISWQQQVTSSMCVCARARLCVYVCVCMSHTHIDIYHLYFSGLLSPCMMSKLRDGLQQQRATDPVSPPPPPGLSVRAPFLLLSLPPCRSTR